MIKIDWVEFFKRLGIFLAGLLIIFCIQTYINNNVKIKTQKIQEVCETEKAAIKLQSEQENIEQKAKYEKQIIELKIQLEKSKILIERMEKQKTYSEMVKKDIKKFISEVDDLFGIKGKKDDK